MEETKPVPQALQYMVEQSNKELRDLQQHLMGHIEEASLELMALLDVHPEDGWKLDLDRMVYMRQAPPQSPKEENAPIVE